MTGAALKALNPVIANQQRAAGLNQNPGNYNNFITWQVGFTFQMPLGMRYPLANSRQAQYVLLRAKAYLQQVVHQTTHSLARFFLEIDANYKQFKTASRLRAAAAQRLDAQRAYYEEGRITIDRFLDAVSQYATAVATEAQYKTTYNISIVALEEAKGTLLAYDNIAVAEGPNPRKAYIQARDIQNAHRQLHMRPDGPQMPQKPQRPANPDPTEPNPPPDADEPQLPPMPAPIGPLGPSPAPLPPHVPTATKPFLSQNGPEAGPVSPAPSAAATSSADGRSSPVASGDMTLTSGAGAPPWSRTTSSAGVNRIATGDAVGLGGRAASAPPTAGSLSSAIMASTPGQVGAGQPPPGSGGGKTPGPDDLPPLPVNIELPPLPDDK
jgi:hypothetical protein